MQAKNGSTFSKDTFNPEITSKKNHYASVASFPLVADQELVGLMCLKNRQPNFFNEDVVKQYQRISQTVAIALVFHDVQLQQRERVKELTCLYEINRTVTGTQLDMDTILASIVKSLPPAWQYPDIAAAQIVLDDKIYSTNEKAIARHSQKASIWVDGRQCGSVEVFYTQDKPELDEGPFLLEERNLIDTIAREVETIIRRKRAEKDRGKLQEQLRHADRLATIGQLAAGVAHELNEPLGGILGFSQLAKKHTALPEEVRKDLNKIESASLHAREIIRKLMLFARQAPSSTKKVNLNQLIADGLYFLAARCKNAGIELNRVLAKDLPDVIADPGQMHQVLVNLVVNAIQASSSGGTVTVETSQDSQHVCMSVTDTGSGMTKDVLNKIFLPFFTTKDVGEGTGLGLPVVHGIITSHGGHIDVKSAPNEGSHFVIRMPIHWQTENQKGS